MIDSFIAQYQQASDDELARALVHTAGTLATEMRDNGLETDYKTSISDVVTEADRAAEAFVAGVLGALRPDDGVLGEEGAARESSSGRTWVIDPVDGTYNFTSNSDYFCSALALVAGSPSEPDELLFGAIDRPIPGQAWFGGPLVGSTLNGSDLPVLEERSLEEISLATYLHPTFLGDDTVRDTWVKVASQPATIRMFGAGSVDLAQVASGRVGAWMQHSVADWDWLPGKALVEGTGGAAIKVDAGGKTWCVAGNKRAAAQICELLAQ